MNQSSRAQQAAKFTTLYQRLNPAQRKAVDTIDGPVLVVAGPGTGKTQVLSARIATILQKTDVAPYNILALTFTESAAKNMQERVVSMIGTEGYYVEITTFHSFCASVITAYPEYFPISRDSQPITDVELFETIKTTITQLPLETLKPLNAPHFYLKEIVRSISQLKREGVSCAAFSAIIADAFAEDRKPAAKGAASTFEKQKLKNQELALVYERYQEKLLEQKRYDFDDMITFVIAAFQEHESLLLEYQEKFQYFLVDEYQDTNSAQNAVVNLLAAYWGEQANIFVVGDPHQSIYRFQGASTENVVSFTSQYPNATVITLETSYRCPAEITTVAHTLISNNILTQTNTTQSPAAKTLFAALTTPLKTIKTQPQAVQVWSAPSQTIELIQIAEEITTLIKNNVRAEDIAILYRTNRESLELAEILEKWQIPYEIDGGNNVFEFEPIRQFLQLLQIIELYKVNQEDERFFEVLCYSWLKLDPLSVYRITHLAGRERKMVHELVENGHAALQVLSPDCLSETEYDQIANLLGKLKSWAIQDGQLTFIEWFALVAAESGFLNWLKQQPTVVEHLLFYNSLRQLVEQFCRERATFKLTEFIAAVDTMCSYGIPLIAQDLHITKGAVHLSTVHKAKGQEWEYVFVVHCTDGVWGNTRERNLLPLPAEILNHTDVTKKERNEDDRRLLYVAITRAKQQVIVSYPETVISNTATKTVTPSMFITEMQASSVGLEVHRDIHLVERQEEFLSRLVAPSISSQHTLQAENFFTDLLERYTLSVSALNNYLQDPAKFILRDLLLIPSGNAPYLAFGTAIHAALEEVFKHIQQGSPLVNEKIFDRYETVLAQEILTREDYERRLVYGKNVLTQYISQLQLEKVDPWQLEARFGRGMRRTVLDDIPLVGRIDRLDWIDRKSKTVRVIDYKTGSAKSRNTLEGKTQSAGLSARELTLPESIRSPFKRQLLFYKLLTQMDAAFSAEVIQGVFEFVVPDSQTGKIAIHAFDLPTTEVEELKDLIRTVMAELRSLQFMEYLPTAISTVGVQNK